MADEEMQEVEHSEPILGPKIRSAFLLLVGSGMLFMNHKDVVTEGVFSIKVLFLGVAGVMFGLGGFVWPHMFDMVGPDGKVRTSKTALALCACTLLISWLILTYVYPSAE